MELSRDPAALSALVGRPVRDVGGRSLGRVWEVRAHWDGDGYVVFNELLVGRGAMLKRLRGPGPDARGIPWDAVAEIAADAIVVRP